MVSVIVGLNVQALAYELEHIESKISVNISTAASENLEFDVPEFLQQLDAECLKVKRAFRHQVVSFENERLVKRYFHFHQESLIDLINTVHTEHQSHDTFLQSILDRLTGLLQYVEEHFPEYFNQDMKVPVSYNTAIKKEVNEFFSLLAVKFGSTKTDSGLLDVIKSSFDQFGTSKSSLTFRQLHYLKLLRLNIDGMNTLGDFETIDLIRLLMHCNFNTESFYNYVLKYVAKSVEDATSLSSKVEQLSYYLKFSNQETSNNAVAFNYLQAPVSVQVAEWLSQELMYLRTKQHLLTTVSSEEIVPSEFKLNFDLSVSILAYLFRAFTETGVIQNKNTSELIRFLSKYVKTKRSESISYESLRIKYYSIETGTKDAVKKMLQTVLNFINKN